MGCAMQTAIRRRRQAKLDQRYSGPRRDAAARARNAEAKVKAERERQNRAAARKASEKK